MSHYGSKNKRLALPRYALDDVVYDGAGKRRCTEGARNERAVDKCKIEWRGACCGPRRRSTRPS